MLGESMDANLDRAYTDIIAEPEADAPRLRYAELAGGDRAELIRQGITLRDMRRRRVESVLPTTELIATLLRKHSEWGADLLPWVKWVEYGRGFVERVSLPAALFVERAPILYAKAPILHVKLTDAAGHLEAIAASPLVARLLSIDLSENQLRDRDALALAESPHLAQLRWLDLGRNRIGEAGIDALAAATARRLPALRFLDLLLNKAQDPTEKWTEDDTGRVDYVDRPEGDALEAKYGPLAWLHHRASLAHPETFY